MTLEADYGVPAVGVHADVFARLVKSVVEVNGMPKARRAFVPTPVTNRTPDQLREYIEGRDPTSGRAFMDEVIGTLTRPLGKDDLRGVGVDRSIPRYVEYSESQDLDRLFRDNDWTDFLPIVVPTEERVERMLSGTSRDRDELVGKMRPTGHREWWSYTVEKVAVNAVMAGAEPEYFPVILALASTGITARQSSTSSMANMVVVNGPIRHEIKMNSGLGALGPYNHANATIGRAYGLLSQNLQGGSIPGESYMGAQGNNLSYANVTFAENEEKSPWVPHHVQHGFNASDSTISTFYVWGNTWTEGLRSTWEEKIKAMLSGLDPNFGVILVMDPIVANEFADLGFRTKDQLVQWIHEHIRIPAKRYWDSYTMRNLMKDVADAGVEPYATYARAEPDQLIPSFERDRINVVVVGGSSNGQWSAFSGRPHEARFRTPEDKIIASVDEWR